MSTRPKLQSVNPQSERESAAQVDREINGEHFTLFKAPWETFSFKEGTFIFRLLPQPEGAYYGYAVTLPHIYADPKKVASMRGYLALTNEQARRMNEAKNALWGHPTFANAMACRANPDGVDLRPRYKDAFIGFLRGNPEGLKLTVVVLPSNGIRPNRSERLQAGTIIRRFIEETDADGAPKYGDIYHPDTGRLIKIEVAGTKDRTEYRPSVDKVFPLDDTYNDLLNQIPRFEDIIRYESDTVFYRYIRRSVTKEMFDYLVSSQNWDVPQDVFNEPSRDAINAMLTQGEGEGGEEDDDPFGSGPPRESRAPAPAPQVSQAAQAPSQPAPAQPAPAQAPSQPAPAQPAAGSSSPTKGKSPQELVAELRAKGVPVPPELEQAS